MKFLSLLLWNPTINLATDPVNGNCSALHKLSFHIWNNSSPPPKERTQDENELSLESTQRWDS